MAEFRYTLNGKYNPSNSVEGYNSPVVVGATSLAFGPGTSIEGYEDRESQFVYSAKSSSATLDFWAFAPTAQTAGFYVDSSDFDNVSRITGGDFGDVFRTGDGDDVLNGGGGNDVLEGGRGINTFDGGTGTNTLSYEHFDAPTGDGSGGIVINMESGSASDGEALLVQDTFSNIANVRGSRYGDVISGDTQNNVIEGGAGVDDLTGGDGIDTLSFAHSSEGVLVDLQENFGLGGDAEGETYKSFENILGSTSDDALYGDGGANTLNGNGGSDAVYGRDGDDRLVIGGSPVMVDGGEGTDVLFIAKDSTVELTDASFAGIEKVYVRDGAILSMSGVDVGTKIFSQSQTGGGATIAGTDGADRIVGGKGGDFIAGGQGGDALFGGAGADTFAFASGDGRDVIRKFDVTEDVLHIGLIASSMDDVKIGSFHGEANTIITFTGDTGASNKIILLGVTADTVTEGSFIF